MKNSRIDIRIPQNLKEMAQAKAKDEKTTVTEVITRYLLKWIENDMVEVVHYKPNNN